MTARSAAPRPAARPRRRGLRAAALLTALAWVFPAAPVAQAQGQSPTQAQPPEAPPAASSQPSPEAAQSGDAGQGGAASPAPFGSPLTLPTSPQALAEPPQPAPFPVLYVDRGALLERSQAAQALRETERSVRERVQAELDEIRDSLEAEENELTVLKETMAPEVFAERARAFDQRVRAARAEGLERRALLQRFLQEAGNALASAVPRVLEGLRREMGAVAILDSEGVLAAAAELDVTNLAVTRYDAEMGGVRFDPPQGLLPH